MTTVLLADDQELIRGGLRLMLEHRGIEVVAEAADGRQAVELVGRARPDVVLMDVRMPVLDGISATAEILARWPSTRVLILTTYDLDDYVYRGLKAGAAGFLLKSVPADRLAEGVAVVAQGEALLAPSLTRRLIEEHVRRPAPGRAAATFTGLTERERQVLGLVARGLSNAEIAAALVVSEATVKTHINRTFAKLGVTSRAHAVVVAYENGLVVPGRQD